MARVLVVDVKKRELRVAECKEIDDFYEELDADIFRHRNKKNWRQIL